MIITHKYLITVVLWSSETKFFKIYGFKINSKASIFHPCLVKAYHENDKVAYMMFNVASNTIVIISRRFLCKLSVLLVNVTDTSELVVMLTTQAWRLKRETQYFRLIPTTSCTTKPHRLSPIVKWTCSVLLRQL